MTRTLPLSILLAVALLGLMGCNAQAKYGQGERILYSCIRGGQPLLAATPCASAKQDYLLLTDDGGALSSFTVYLDLCDAYKVTVVGGYEVVGTPPFEHERLLWHEHGRLRDSLEATYANSSCKYYFEM